MSGYNYNYDCKQFMTDQAAKNMILELVRKCNAINLDNISFYAEKEYDIVVYKMKVNPNGEWNLYIDYRRSQELYTDIFIIDIQGNEIIYNRTEDWL